MDISRYLTPGKLFYSIGEVAAMFGVNASLIRYWDKEFDLVDARDGQANRKFTPHDIERFQLVYHLVKECGLTLNGAKQRLRNKRSETEADFQVVKKLELLKNALQAIRDEL